YRTLPLYYLVLLLKILIFGNPYGYKIIVYFLFLQANFIGIDFFSVSWSLVVEEWFYIFLPLAAFMFFSKGIQPRKFIVFLLAIIAFFFLARFFWNYYHKGVIIYQFDCLLLGVLIALMKIYYRTLYLRLNSILLFLSGLAGIIFLTFLLGDMHIITVYDTFFRVTWYFMISICIAIIIPFIEQSAFLNISLKKIKPLYFFFSWTSILTYSIYLLHADVYRLHLNVPEYVNVFLQVILLYGLSFIVYAFYEHPMMSLREQLSFGQYWRTIKKFSFRL
ncbi:MAG: putative acyltransferase, partial [Bacteroidetes bacterium]|nr:putative acyltransferase [Bacteroidota bacterium]